MFTFDLAKSSSSPLTLGALVVALSTLTGCSTAPTARPATPSPSSGYASAAAAARPELPPGAMEFSFDDGRVHSFTAEAPRQRLLPGRTQRPRHLLVH